MLRRSIPPTDSSDKCIDTYCMQTGYTPVHTCIYSKCRAFSCPFFQATDVTRNNCAHTLDSVALWIPLYWRVYLSVLTRTLPLHASPHVLMGRAYSKAFSVEILRHTQRRRGERREERKTETEGSSSRQRRKLSTDPIMNEAMRKDLLGRQVRERLKGVRGREEAKRKEENLCCAGRISSLSIHLTILYFLEW